MLLVTQKEHRAGICFCLCFLVGVSIYHLPCFETISCSVCRKLNEKSLAGHKLIFAIRASHTNGVIKQFSMNIKVGSGLAVALYLGL